MKKYSYLIIIVLFSSLVLAGCSLLSNIGQAPTIEQSGMINLTKGGSSEIPLIAGQNIDVGEVQVYNDDTYLYIKYIIDEPGWYLTETHLHVACSEEDIPQNKKGNPTPGKFMYNMEHNYIQEYELAPIPLENIGCNNPDEDPAIVIAAHAVVQNLSEELYLSNGGTGSDADGLYTVELSGGNANLTQIYNFNGVANFNFVTHIAASPDGSIVYVIGEDSGHLGAYTVSSGSFDDLGDITGYTPGDVVQAAISPEGEFFMVGQSTDDLYKVDVSIPSASYVGFTGIDIIGADIAFSADGTLYLYTNSGNELYTVDTSTGACTFVGNTDVKLTGLAIRQGGIGPLLGSDGDNNEIVEISTSDGSKGATFNMNIDHLWGDMTVGQFTYSETAWGEGDRFVEQGNWATYFSYDVLLDTITVNSNGNKYYSSVNLQEDKEYILKASGTYTYWPAQLPGAGIADAKYSLRPEGSFNLGPGPRWISGDDLPSPWTHYLELLVDEGYKDWGIFNLAHTYSTEYTGDGASVCFNILDSGYGDNSGSLTVEIYWIP